MPTQSENRLEQQYAGFYQDWKNTGTPESASAMLQQIDPVINKAITSYAGGSKSPNVRSHARQIALDALESYDPQKAKLQTHLLNQLQGLRRQVAKEKQVLSVPEQVMLDNQHLYRASMVLQDKLGRDPSDREVSDHTGISLKRLAYVRQYQSPLAEGTLVDPTQREGGSPAMPAVMQNDPTGWHEFVYNDLNEVDKAIMEYTLGLHGIKQLPTTEIAKKLNISPGAVSQRAQRIQAKLNQREELGLGL